MSKPQPTRVIRIVRARRRSIQFEAAAGLDLAPLEEFGDLSNLYGREWLLKVSRLYRFGDVVKYVRYYTGQES